MSFRTLRRYGCLPFDFCLSPTFRLAVVYEHSILSIVVGCCCHVVAYTYSLLHTHITMLELWTFECAAAHVRAVPHHKINDKNQPYKMLGKCLLINLFVWLACVIHIKDVW